MKTAIKKREYPHCIGCAIIFLLCITKNKKKIHNDTIIIQCSSKCEVRPLPPPGEA